MSRVRASGHPSSSCGSDDPLRPILFFERGRGFDQELGLHDHVIRVEHTHAAADTAQIKWLNPSFEHSTQALRQSLCDDRCLTLTLVTQPQVVFPFLMFLGLARIELQMKRAANDIVLILVLRTSDLLALIVLSPRST